MRRLITFCLLISLFCSICASAGTWTTLDVPGASGTQVFGIDGSNVVGHYYQQGVADYGFRYDGTNYYQISAPSARNTYARGISGSRIVGYYSDNSSVYRGFINDGSNWEILQAPDAKWTFANGIDGINVVGRFQKGGSWNGFLYNGTTWTTINPPGSVNTEACGITGSEIYGTYTDGNGNIQGFIHDFVSQTWTTILMPGDGDGNTPGRRVNPYDGDSGRIVGYYDNNNSIEKGFIYDGSAWLTLQMPGQEKTWAYGISASRIVGSALEGTTYHGFVYTIPEPASALLMIMGAALIRKKFSR